ncbi:MAG: hypothetical protein HY671_04235 [Chloroflexi bacterium]|nr:hypothetical protein [Chloroflexota bacterium]
MTNIWILNDGEDKLKAWYQYHPNASAPNSPYRMVLKARGGATSNVDPSGKMSNSTLNLIDKTLWGPFKMRRQMVEEAEFKQRLVSKLAKKPVRDAVIRLRDANISLDNPAKFREEARILYEELSAGGPGCLSQEDKAFCVGATKTMHFLFPEFLIMLDKWAAWGVGYKKYNNLKAYWEVLELCKAELDERRVRYGTLDTLLELDVPPTTPTRIFDKRAYVMGNPDVRKVY